MPSFRLFGLLFITSAVVMLGRRSGFTSAAVYGFMPAGNLFPQLVSMWFRMAAISASVSSLKLGMELS